MTKNIEHYLLKLLDRMITAHSIKEEELKQVIYIYCNTTIEEEKSLALSILKKINEETKIIKEKIDTREYYINFLNQFSVKRII